MLIMSSNSAKFQIKSDQESFLLNNTNAHSHTAYAFLHRPPLKH